MNILIAPNAFKNALSAGEVALALQEGILQSGFKGIVQCCPVGDGGDGTGALLRQYFNAGITNCNTIDALGRPVEAALGVIDHTNTAIIELADASGLRLLKPAEYDPLKANTIGTGILLKAALNKAVSKIILCIGGSATVDGGTGILKELGVVFRDKKGNEIVDLPAGLIELDSIDNSKLTNKLQATEIIILCDVNNKLLGARGAAAVFAPQKGATAADVKFLEKCLTRLDEVVYKTTGKRMSEMPYSGAAGGVAAALGAFGKAEAVAGINYFLEAIHFEEQLKHTDLVITGEGAIDHQTLEGKAPFGVAQMAKRFNMPVIAVAGKIQDEEDATLNKYFDELICINQPNTPLPEALKNTYKNLVRTGTAIGSRI